MLFGLRYFLPHICLVYEHDIKDTDCWAQNGSTPSITVICNKQDKKSNENLLYIYFIQPLLIGPVILLQFSFPFLKKRRDVRRDFFTPWKYNSPKRRYKHKKRKKKKKERTKCKPDAVLFVSPPPTSSSSLFCLNVVHTIKWDNRKVW